MPTSSSSTQLDRDNLNLNKAAWTLKRTSLLREVYRSLINTGRSYAAFTQKDKKLIESLQGRGEILDPTSGYGGLTKYCSEIGMQSYSVEVNLPQYLWQLLCNPIHTTSFMEVITALLSSENTWPKASVRAIVSEEWYPVESKNILLGLLNMVEQVFLTNFNVEDCKLLSVALLTPFCGRLSCCVPGNVSPNVKGGGICVYQDWGNDFRLYLEALYQRFKLNRPRAKELCHHIHFGDAKTYVFPHCRFGGMVTSPPYPNSRDFISMFAPEHDFLRWIGLETEYELKQEEKHVIGSNFVSGRPRRSVTTQTVLRFFDKINSLDMSKNASYDEEKYYLPYFENYFADLEEAYLNVSKAARQDFEGYVIVVNNTHRNIIVPVSDAVVEIWENLGFQAEVFDALELFHIGVKNPRARGLRARHTEYVIKVWR